MSEVIAPTPVPSDPAPEQSVVAHPLVKPGSICPTCGQKVPGPSVLRRVLRGARVILHDPAVDRRGKQLAGILAVRVLVYVGASDALVSGVRQLLHVVGA